MSERLSDEELEAWAKWLTSDHPNHLDRRARTPYEVAITVQPLLAELRAARVVVEAARAAMDERAALDHEHGREPTRQDTALRSAIDALAGAKCPSNHAYPVNTP